jgi:hypothetical protein
MATPRGVDKFFPVKNIYSPKQKMIGDRERKNQSEGKKKVASGFLVLLAKPDFHSHMASWRVIIRTRVIPPPLPYRQCWVRTLNVNILLKGDYEYAGNSLFPLFHRTACSASVTSRSLGISRYMKVKVYLNY